MPGQLRLRLDLMPLFRQAQGPELVEGHLAVHLGVELLFPDQIENFTQDFHR